MVATFETHRPARFSKEVSFEHYPVAVIPERLDPNFSLLTLVG